MMFLNFRIFALHLPENPWTISPSALCCFPSSIFVVKSAHSSGLAKIAAWRIRPKAAKRLPIEAEYHQSSWSTGHFWGQQTPDSLAWH